MSVLAAVSEDARLGFTAAGLLFPLALCVLVYATARMPSLRALSARWRSRRADERFAASRAALQALTPTGGHVQHPRDPSPRPRRSTLV